MTTAKDTYKNYKGGGVLTGEWPLVENLRVLEIGIGTGDLLKALKEKENDVYGVDIGEEIISKSKSSGFKNVWLLDVSEEPLPFEDDFFDAVYCYEVFEHLTNPHRMFSEIRRVLKPGALLYFSAPTQEKTMGYGPLRHSFVYPGLLLKENLERFFMQMYFKIKKQIESNSILLVGRSYILKNMKSGGKPDIVEVIIGDYSVKELYGDILEKDALSNEIEKETGAYFKLAEAFMQTGDWEKLDDLLTILLNYYSDYFPMYLRLAELAIKYNQQEMAQSILLALLANNTVPKQITQEAADMVKNLEEK